MHKKLLILSILFSFSTALPSTESNSKLSKGKDYQNYLQVINNGQDTVEALYGKTPEPENLATKTYSNAELVLVNPYICNNIQPYLSDELPYTTRDDSIHQEQNRCVDAIKTYDYIAYKESIEMLELLAARFSNHTEKPNYITSYKDRWGYNLLHYACLQKISDSVDKTLHEKIQCLIIKELYNHKVDIHGKNSYGETPMHCTTSTNACAIKFLHTLGADINAQDIKGKTPIHTAAYWNEPVAVKAFLNLNADTTIKNNQGQTAEQMTDNPEILALLAADRADRQKIQDNRTLVVEQPKFKLKHCLRKRKNS